MLRKPAPASEVSRRTHINVSRLEKYEMPFVHEAPVHATFASFAGARIIINYIQSLCYGN